MALNIGKITTASKAPASTYITFESSISGYIKSSALGKRTERGEEGLVGRRENTSQVGEVGRYRNGNKVGEGSWGEETYCGLLE